MEMNKHQKSLGLKQTTFARSLSLALATIAVTAAGTPAAFAQQASSLGRVEVTGSRILSINAESAAPVQVFSSADIAASGVANVQDLLLKLPVFGTPAINRTNSNFSTSSAGIAVVDLRNLGQDRTLVLVNGRRYISGQPGSSAVDLNTIPADFIERVEVLTGGASSVYGSDAIAGVVNIILKRNFSGLNFDAQVGRSSAGDDEKTKFAATVGGNFADNRGNLMAHMSVSRQGAVYSRDREMSAVDQASKGAFVTGDGADAFVVQRPFYSSFAPQGRFFYRAAGRTTDSSYTYSPTGAEIPFSTNGPAGDGVGATGFNRSAFRTIAIPTDRLLLATKGEFNLGDSHTAFFEGTYAATSTKTRLEPFPLDSNDLDKNTGGFLPAELMFNGVKVRNEAVPLYLYNLATDVNGDGLRDFRFTRRMSDIDVRGNKAERDTFRVVGGVKGDLNKVWSYDAYAVYGYTKEGQTSTGQVNVANFKNALQVVTDSAGNTRCLDLTAVKQGCVPAYIFGANTLSKAASDYISAPGSLNTKITQTVAGFSVSGEPFEGPAGPVGIAAGTEYREETSSTEFDALTQKGLNAGNALGNTAGSFNVKEYFVEGRVPLLKDLPMVKSLDATAAVRRGDYSSVGGTTSWNAGLDWAANSTIRFRATSAVSTRAPNIGDLFQANSQTFPTGLVDPCRNILATDTSTVGVNCRNAVGVAANQAANGGKFTLNQADLQGTSGYDSGNTALQPEKGKSNTLGLVITPKTMFKNFAITADYFDISIDDAINNPGRQFTLDQCYRLSNPVYCKFITRRATNIGSNSAGSLDLINQIPENSGGQKIRGLDLTVAIAENIGSGRATARLSYTKLIEAWTKASKEADLDTSVGEVGSPEHKWTLNLGYDVGAFGIRATTTYIAKSYLDDQFITSNDWTKEDGAIPAKTYLDLQFTYNASKKAQFYFGLDNALDTKAPMIPSGLPGNNTGTETNAGTYDAIGRKYYVGLRYSM